MIRFLLKGIWRDRSRSLLPIIIVSIGVAITVLLSGYMRGAMGDVTEQNARFDTGHMKIMTRAYAENKSQIPNDLAVLGVDTLIQSLESDFPEVLWVPRIKFGGLIDVPDSEGVTRGQGPGAGFGLVLYSGEKGEVKRMNIGESIVSGSLPSSSGQALISSDFAEKLSIQPGDTVTFIGSTMNGSMTFQNFVISGTIRFGAMAMDRGTIIVDIQDAREMLDMDDAAGEILGFLKTGVYFDDQAASICMRFNEIYKNSEDEYAPTMVKLKDQNNLAGMLDYAETWSGIFVGIFVIAMSIVLWNTGLLGGLRRYQEYGIRLAMGESKGGIYKSLIMEALLVGAVGSVVGTIIGLSGVMYLQVVGIDISEYMANSTMLMPNIIRAKFHPDQLFIGFIPGLFAMVLGNMLAGVGIYRRETAVLFKELEV